MGLLLTLTVSVTLLPVLQSTTVVLKRLHELSASLNFRKSNNGTNLSLTPPQINEIQETLTFWIIWPFLSSVIKWLPLGNIIGLYVNVWLVWPVVNSPQAGKITGVRFILNDYVPKWISTIDEYKLSVVNWLLSLQQNQLLDVLLSALGLKYIWPKLQALRDSLVTTNSQSTYDTSYVTSKITILESLIAPFWNFTQRSPVSPFTATNNNNNNNNNATTAKQFINEEVFAKQGSFEDFSIVTEMDLKETASDADTTGLEARTSANPQNRKTSNSSRKVSSSSLGSKFGFFS